jgi:hypothetical protein
VHPAYACVCVFPAGDRDLICNWLGNRRWVDQLQWEGLQGWSQAQDKAWMVQGQQAGLVTSYDTLSFVKVFQAVSGHGSAAGADAVYRNTDEEVCACRPKQQQRLPGLLLQGYMQGSRHLFCSSNTAALVFRCCRGSRCISYSPQTCVTAGTECSCEEAGGLVSLHQSCKRSPPQCVYLLLMMMLQGHMVPMDQPAAALDMITRFMRDDNLADTDDIFSTTAGKQQLQETEPQAAAIAVV